ncbi:MAG TPA: hypothetical protein VK184_02535 [Nostocaceae cyanobacterium]|nr:hypothetical protein [Nostocaceae cyanobacterium]
MVYIAVKLNNRSQETALLWLVVESADVQEKVNGTVKLPSRRHIAYFVNQETAEQDAKQFAEYKNIQENSHLPTEYLKLLANKTPAQYHTTFESNLQSSTGTMYWAVQELCCGMREDIAYFFDPQTAQADAEAFSLIRDHHLKMFHLSVAS